MRILKRRRPAEMKAEAELNGEFDRRTLLRKAASLTAGAAGILALPATIGTAAAQAPPAQSNSAMWVATTQTAPWQTKSAASSGGRGGFGGGGSSRDLDVLLDAPAQAIEGFGGCFNELGWTSLQALSAADRESITRELFAPGVGANLTICRMPVGANDLETLVPFLKNAQGYNPALRLSGSERTVSVTAGTKRSRISMDADSINTLLLSRDA